MNVFTHDDIWSRFNHFSQWYHADYFPKDWKGTALDVLNNANMPIRERLSLVIRGSGWLPPRVLYEFIVARSERILKAQGSTPECDAAIAALRLWMQGKIEAVALIPYTTSVANHAIARALDIKDPNGAAWSLIVAEREINSRLYISDQPDHTDRDQIKSLSSIVRCYVRLEERSQNELKHLTGNLVSRGDLGGMLERVQRIDKDIANVLTMIDEIHSPELEGLATMLSLTGQTIHQPVIWGILSNFALYVYGNENQKGYWTNADA